MQIFLSFLNIIIVGMTNKFIYRIKICALKRCFCTTMYPETLTHQNGIWSYQLMWNKCGVKKIQRVFKTNSDRDHGIRLKDLIMEFFLSNNLWLLSDFAVALHYTIMITSIIRYACTHQIWTTKYTELADEKKPLFKNFQSHLIGKL
jgi:hypothetical protein